MERLKVRLKRGGVKGTKLDEAMARVRCAEGSLISPLWGLSESDLAWIRGECDLFIHCAASTSFIDTASCEAINVQGTRHMLDVVRGAKNIKRLVHFSTATLCGYLPNRCIKEEESLPQGGNHVFAYTRTKAEAEKILWESNIDIPLLVLRPSITMAYGSTDRKQTKLFLWSMIAAAQLPFVPVRREALNDFVTLDFVVDCTMRLIARGDKLKYNCYHLTAGRMAAVTAGEVYDVACSKSTRDRLPEAIPLDKWDESHEQAIDEEGLTSLYEAIHLYLPFTNLNLIYDNSRLIEELGDDLPALPKFTEYMNEMLATIDPELVTLAADEAFGI
jgi:nucleoside-diphosphate-sugar epimerase